MNQPLSKIYMKEASRPYPNLSGSQSSISPSFNFQSLPRLRQNTESLQHHDHSSPDSTQVPPGSLRKTRLYPPNMRSTSTLALLAAPAVALAAINVTETNTVDLDAGAGELGWGASDLAYGYSAGCGLNFTAGMCVLCLPVQMTPLFRATNDHLPFSVLFSSPLLSTSLCPISQLSSPALDPRPVSVVTESRGFIAN